MPPTCCPSHGQREGHSPLPRRSLERLPHGPPSRAVAPTSTISHSEQLPPHDRSHGNDEGGQCEKTIFWRRKDGEHGSKGASVPPARRALQTLGGSARDHQIWTTWPGLSHPLSGKFTRPLDIGQGCGSCSPPGIDRALTGPDLAPPGTHGKGSALGLARVAKDVAAAAHHA